MGTALNRDANVPAFDAALLAELQHLNDHYQYRTRRVKEAAEGPEIEVEGRRYVNFSSNDYLGLSGDPRVVTAFQRGLARYGAGAGASHLVSGHCQPHHALELELAAFTTRPRALLFSTGYLANLGVGSALFQRNDTVIQDRANHASLVDAAILSRARLVRYPHRDIGALERLLSKGRGERTYVVTDAVFSMDGGLAPLVEIAALCARHEAVLVVDDAHGFGVLGADGAGALNQLGLGLGEAPILMATCGKALGVFGAFVAGSEPLIETLIQRARSYIYTTAMPPAMAEAVRESLALLRLEGWRRTQLRTLIEYFRAGAQGLGVKLGDSRTPIQPIILGHSRTTLEVAELLRNRGYYVVAVRPPTVPKDTARLRITLTANHTPAHIDGLLAALTEVPCAVS
ncbi:MAG: 8-amino-7-oxononanoate synthase [Gammaproteobacteria bacterium]